MTRAGLLWCAAVFTVSVGGGAALGPVLGSVLGSVLGTAAPGWREIAWPFPRDAWQAGRAFRCGSAECGGEVEVYVRVKRGFCANCAAGVRDDAEVDGVADLDMISADFVPTGSGQRVAAAGLVGRMRVYTLQQGSRTTPAAGYAMTRQKQCDLIVAASRGEAAGTPAAQDGVRALLASSPVAGWVHKQLGG